MQQEEKCALCKTDTPNARGWTTDHDHETGLVRGILCHTCNIKLAAYEEMKANPKTEEYLSKGKVTIDS